ncbi:Uncharacterised protein [Mycobacteroides abscessus subsp. abscessus]|nr:Uncharacterised protein [Mycobacteroides abscessus subsp. abscessus]
MNASTRAPARAQSAHCSEGFAVSVGELSSVRIRLGPSHLRARSNDSPGASEAGVQV